MFAIINQSAFKRILCLTCFCVFSNYVLFAQIPKVTNQENATMVTPKISKDIASTTPSAPTIPIDKEGIKNYLAFLDGLDTNLSIEQQVLAVNSYIEKTYKTKGTLTVEGYLKQVSNGYHNETSDAAPLIDLLKVNGKISEPLHKYLKALNTKLLSTTSEADILPVLQAASKEIAANKYAFEKGEQERLLAFLQEREAFCEYWATTKPVETKSISSRCRLCLILNHIWVSPLTILEGAMDFFFGPNTFVSSNGTITTQPNIGLVLVRQLCARPCNVPPVQNCSTCPAGYRFDGVNCASQVYLPQGSIAFMWSGNFYYSSPGNKTCPIGGTFDSANCYYSPIPPGYQGFIWNNSFYVKPKCN